jgi:oxygen-dependent protoporphyrinogen oxidase
VKRVIIVGGGISGLATAHAVLAKDAAAELTLLERAPRVGGNIVTVREDGLVLDGGPDSWVANKPHATTLAKSLGLGGDLIGTVPENRRSLIAWGDELHPLPEGFVLGVPTSILPILRTPLFSLKAKARMALEPFVPRRARGGADGGNAGDDDESIDAFIRRRLGPEVAERLVAPLLGGIYGGDAGQLSMRATLPQFVEMEQQHGSLIRAMKRTLVSGGGGKQKPSMFTSLVGGLGGLVDKLESAIGAARIRKGVTVVRVAPLPAGDARGRFALELDGGDAVHADDVVMAVPAHVAALALRPFGEPLTQLLSAMPYVSTGVVMLAFARGDVPGPLDATGYIVPRVLGRPALAATWVTSKWAHRAPEGTVLIRVFLGGKGHEDLLDREDDELVSLARTELGRAMHVEAAPSMTRVFRFRRASPQPLVGHPGRMQKARAILAETPGLHLVASGYDGVGLPDCVRQAEEAASAIVSR